MNLFLYSDIEVIEDDSRMIQKSDPCQKFACELQVCLQKHQYQESKCQDAIKRLVKCCSIWKEESFKVCSGIEYEDHPLLKSPKNDSVKS